ncbi:MAG: TetR/AcrR family transcriptional regulator [Pseudomonadota bacterium]
MSDRKKEILSLAIEIIARQGYASLTMRALAKASGMKLGALQYHFATREALLTALTQYIGQIYQESLDALERRRSLSIRDVVEWYLQDSGGDQLHSDWLWPQLWAMGRVEPQMRALLADVSQHVVALFEYYLEQAGSTNARVEAIAILSLAEGSTLFVGDGSPWQQDAYALTNSILNAIEARYGGANESDRVA